MLRLAAELYLATRLVRRYPKIAFIICRSGPIKALAHDEDKLVRLAMEIVLSAATVYLFEVCPPVAIALTAYELRGITDTAIVGVRRRRALTRIQKAMK